MNTPDDTPLAVRDRLPNARRVLCAIGAALTLIVVALIANMTINVRANAEQTAQVEATLNALERLSQAELADDSLIAKNTCRDNTDMMVRYCDTPAHFENCFTLVAEVERIVHFEQRDAVFSHLRALEPQSGPVFLWSVDETTAAEDSHLDTTVESTAAYFNNTAYYYSQSVHQQSVGCGGWSLGLWKTRADQSPGNTPIRSLQLAYCRTTAASRVRICGGFNVRTDS